MIKNGIKFGLDRSESHLVEDGGWEIEGRIRGESTFVHVVSHLLTDNFLFNTYLLCFELILLFCCAASYR
jgi:hypothetical protein